jgi:hypothetical protein
MMSSTASPAAIETGLPPKVLKWIRWVSASAISRRVVTAASGQPLPIPLAMVTMSGTTPACWNPQ